MRRPSWWQPVTRIALGVLAGVVASVGTLAVSVAGFALSYDAVRKVGIAAHIRADWAWLLPVSVDGAMAVATVAAVVMHRMTRRTPVYPWAVVVAGAGISIACNALHADGVAGAPLVIQDAGVRMAVAGIPALMLALSVHLLVMLTDALARTLDAHEATHMPASVPVELPMSAGTLADEQPASASAETLMSAQVRAGIVRQADAQAAGGNTGKPMRKPVRKRGAQALPVAVPATGNGEGDKREDARQMWRAAQAAGEDLSGAALGRMYGMSARWGQDRRAEAIAGNAPTSPAPAGMQLPVFDVEEQHEHDQEREHDQDEEREVVR